jgi:hypothetical protein
MQRASVSRIVNLTEPDYSGPAKRFIRWRKKRRKPKKLVFVRYWRSRKPIDSK